VRRWTLLLAGAALWLFLAAIPALADGGPHVAATNSGVSSLTADGCAGCHRAHTATGPYLLNAAGDEALCLTCHGAAGPGATTDVMTGVQYAPVSATDGTRTGTQLGALRNGGFDQARIGDPFRIAGTVANSEGRYSVYGKVQVSNTTGDVTSAHLEMAANGLNQPGKAWGSGANGTDAGPAVTISCGSCHNPHGNGQYRILNPIDGTAVTGMNARWTAAIYGVGGGTYRTIASHGLLIGDTVTIAGNSNSSLNGTALVVKAVANTTFTVTSITTGDGSGGTVTRVGGVKVTDAANTANATRNYTVIQTPTGLGYTLLASQAAAFSATSGDYLHYRVPWDATSGSSNYDAPNGIPAATTTVSGFGEQITAWCTACHTRYYARSQPTDASGGTGAAYNTARPGASDGTFSATKDSVFTYQHRTNGSSGRGCVTCHVSHGSNAVMNGTFSSTFTYPDGTASASSRLLKVDNRGTCQLCHDPTYTILAGAQYPLAPYPIPGRP
jgi:predicted CXXCH cytochrome family protein